MLSRYIAVGMGLGLLIAIMITFLIDSKYSLWIVPFVAGLGGLYALHPAIDWWWANKRKPEMDEKLKVWIRTISPFYRSLDEVDKKKFENRIMLYLLANEYLLRSPDDFGAMPDDLKSFFAVPAVEMTFNRTDNWRLKKFERLVIYPNKFPSPNHPKHIHASEMETVDGVIIAALSELLAWSQNQEQRFSLLHYEMGKAFMFSFPNEGYPIDLVSWEIIEKIGGWSEEQLSKEVIGLPNIDITGVAICFYFTKAERMKSEAPDLYEALDRIFNLNFEKN